MKKSISSVSSNFIDFGLGLKTKTYDEANSCIDSYLESLSASDYRTLISDPYWDNYPEYVYRHSPSNKRRSLGPTILMANSHVAEYMPKKFQILKKYSQGIFLKHCINFSPILEQQNLAKRGMLSKDARVRRKSVEHLKRSELKNFMDDSNSAVAWAVKNRMLRDKIDLHLLDDDRYGYFQRRVISSINISADEAKARINAIVERSQSDSPLSWHDTQMISELLKKLNSIDVAFYMDLASHNDEISDRIKYRLRD